MNTIIAYLIFAPAAVSIIFAFISIIRWIITKEKNTAKDQILVAVTGPFALFFPRLISGKSKKYYLHFLISSGFFIIYCTVLSLVFIGLG
jgi:hypothetical protein